MISSNYLLDLTSIWNQGAKCISAMVARMKFMSNFCKFVKEQVCGLQVLSRRHLHWMLALQVPLTMKLHLA